MCSCEDCAALCRTAQLLRMDVFGSEPDNDHGIVSGLRATTARIVADQRTAMSPGGQTAIATLYGQLIMMGLQVDLDVPDVALVAPQPPLEGDRLVAALLGYSDDLMPGGSSSGSDHPEIVFALGDTEVPRAAVRLSWTNHLAIVVPGNEDAPAPAGTRSPFGPIAAAAAAAAEGVRAAIPVIAEFLEVALPNRPTWRGPGTRWVSVNLEPVVNIIEPRLGEVDAISGGAITNAAIYCLLRVPDLAGRMRVVEDDLLEPSNLNRYGLARRSRVGGPKTDLLESLSTDRFQIVGERMRLEDSTADALRPLASQVLVGVDHIPSRWLAQDKYGDARLCVGATSHDFVLVSEHRPGTPCAGCSHPNDDDGTGPIPTIAFVSLWAGLVQSAFLLSGRDRSPGRAADVWPLGLHNPRGLRQYRPDANTCCPVRCRASQALRSQAS